MILKLTNRDVNFVVSNLENLRGFVSNRYNNIIYCDKKIGNYRLTDIDYFDNKVVLSGFGLHDNEWYDGIEMVEED